MMPKTMLESLIAKNAMVELAKGTPEQAQQIVDTIDIRDQETGNVIAVKFGGWKEVARRFPEILDRLDGLLEEDPNYNSQTLVGVTAMCRSKGFEMNMDGVRI
jgi:hypothetical protein